MRFDRRWNEITQIVQALRVAWRRGWAACTPIKPLPFRGRPTLRLDAMGQSACTACGVCMDDCPTHCIQIEKTIESRFEVDWRRCMYCGLCVEVCPVNALEVCTEPMPAQEYGS